jgi:hypothetical protein
VKNDTRIGRGVHDGTFNAFTSFPFS